MFRVKVTLSTLMHVGLVDSHASLLLLSRVEVSVVSAEYLWPLQDVAMKRYKSEVERERQCGETKFEGSFS